MPPVPTLITELSTTIASNSPTGSESPASLDDYQRAHAAFIAQLNAQKAGLTLANTFSGANTFSALQTLSGAALNEAATVIVPSATSTDIGAAASNNVDISGVVTITGFGTAAEGINRKGRFTGALTLTHNATSLILPGLANIPTAANDRYEARSLGAGNWIVTKYVYADGRIATATLATHPVRADQNVNDLTSVSVAVATGFLTIGLQPCVIKFRNSALANGLGNTKFVAAALTLATTDIGASLGLVTAVQGRLYMLAIDDGTATPRLGVINSSGGNPLDETGVLTSTTAIAGTVVSPTTVYTTAALGAGLYPYKVVGAVDIVWTSGSGYVTTPALVTGVGGMALNNKIVQIVRTQTGALATGTTILPADDTIPQITEGDQYMTRTITPRSASNRLRIDVVVFSSVNDVSARSVAIFRDAVVDALAAGLSTMANAGYVNLVAFSHDMSAGGVAEITFRVRAGPSAAATMTFNGAASARNFGGVMASSITVTEYTP